MGDILWAIGSGFDTWRLHGGDWTQKGKGMGLINVHGN